MLSPTNPSLRATSRGQGRRASNSKIISELSYTAARITLIDQMLNRFSDVSSVYAWKSWPTNGTRRGRIIISQRQAKKLFGSLALRILPEPENKVFEQKDFNGEKAAWMADVKSCLERLLADLEGEREIIEN